MFCGCFLLHQMVAQNATWLHRKVTKKSLAPYLNPREVEVFLSCSLLLHSQWKSKAARSEQISFSPSQGSSNPDSSVVELMVTFLWGSERSWLVQSRASEEHWSSVSNQAVISEMLKLNQSWTCRETSVAFQKFYLKLSRTVEDTLSRCSPNLPVECYSPEFQCNECSKRKPQPGAECQILTQVRPV